MDSAYVPLDDVAKYFGVSLSTARLWLRDGLFPPDSYIEVGTTRRFRIKPIEKALFPQKDVEVEEDFFTEDM
tara:strand:+ start:66 stop:281 length:216 start_codon:yes stop_codon:yes gene_type:complete